MTHHRILTSMNFIVEERGPVNYYSYFREASTNCAVIKLHEPTKISSCLPLTRFL